MALFRKLSSNLVPMFRKLPGEVSVIGRKITNTTNTIDKGLAKADKIVETGKKLNIPNPLLKIAGDAIEGARGINKGVGTGGQAIRAGAMGDVQGALSLGTSAIKEATGGLGKVGQAVAESAPLVALL